VLEVFLAGLVGYLLGSVPTGVLICRAVGAPDVRHSGSTHTGGLNVSRAAGAWAGVLTGVVDALLGAAAVTVAMWLTDEPWAATAAGVMSVVGHNWSVFIGFGGGIGLSTLLGAQLRFSLREAVVAVVILGLLLLALIKVLGGHRARATILASAVVGPVLWALRVPWPGILLGAVGGLVVIVKSLSDWSREFGDRQH
jgi:glycerol-3-phosphate acyltransferase PlsY